MKHTQLTDELQERASLYAAGAMPESERSEYARHLEDDQCGVCQAEVNELQAAMGMLAFSVAPAEPSPAVRARLMEEARKARPAQISQSFVRRHWLELIVGAAAVASFVVTIAATQANNELRNLTNALVSRINQLETQLAQQGTYLAKLTAPEVRVFDLAGQGRAPQATAKIFWDQPGKKWFFYVKNLPPASSNEIYQLWFVPKTGAPIDAQRFNTDASGSVEIEIDLPPNATDLKAPAVTTEPFPGVDQPTGGFVLLGQ